MTITTKVSLADESATKAWADAGYESFDEAAAAGMDTDSDGKVTSTEITNYVSKSNSNSTAANSLTNITTEVTDSKSYEVVDIGQAPDSYSGMKDVLNKCIKTFDGISAYVKDLVSGQTPIVSKMDATKAEVDTINIVDTTGSGTSSAYSLTLASEAAENSTAATSSDDPNSQAEGQLEVKNKQMAAYSEELLGFSDKINGARKDMETTADSANKVVNKVGGEPIDYSMGSGQKIANGAMIGAVAGAAVGSAVIAIGTPITAASVALAGGYGTATAVSSATVSSAVTGGAFVTTSPAMAALACTVVGLVVVAAVVAITCLFKKKNHKQEVIDLGKQAKQHCQQTQDEFVKSTAFMDEASKSSDNLKTAVTTKNNKLYKVRNDEKAAKEAAEKEKTEGNVPEDQTNTPETPTTDNDKKKKIISFEK